MRKIFTCFILITFWACKEKPRNFYGIGEFKLDSKFENLSSSNRFKRLSNTDFKIDSLKISENIGFVKNLEVRIDNGKIYDVKFDCLKSTKVSAIDSLMKDFSQYNSLHNVENKSLPIQMFSLTDGNVIFSKNIFKEKDLISYRYCDIKKLLEYSQ